MGAAWIPGVGWRHVKPRPELVRDPTIVTASADIDEWKARAERAEAALIVVAGLAESWAYQSTDHDEDTEAQIAAGQRLIALLASHGLHAGLPEWCSAREYSEPYPMRPEAAAQAPADPHAEKVARGRDLAAELEWWNGEQEWYADAAWTPANIRRACDRLERDQ